MKKIIIVGYLGKDAEMKKINDDVAINFSIASTEKYNDSKGIKVEKTTWFNATIWKKEEQTNIVKYLTKGTLVFLEGDPNVLIYSDKKSGETKGSIDVRVTNIQLLSSKKEDINSMNDKDTKDDNNSLKEDSTNDDDLPF